MQAMHVSGLQHMPFSGDLAMEGQACFLRVRHARRGITCALPFYGFGAAQALD